MRDADVVGPAFLLNAVGGAVIAVLLVLWRHWVPPLLAVGFGLSTLAAFVISATVGLFGVEEGWTGWAVWTAAVAEVVAIVTGGLLLRADNPLRSRAQSQHHASGRACAPRLTRCRPGPRTSPAVSRIVMPPTERQLPTCSVCPSRVRTTRV